MGVFGPIIKLNPARKPQPQRQRYETADPAKNKCAAPSPNGSNNRDEKWQGDGANPGNRRTHAKGERAFVRRKKRSDGLNGQWRLHRFSRAEANTRSHNMPARNCPAMRHRRKAPRRYASYH